MKILFCFLPFDHRKRKILELSGQWQWLTKNVSHAMQCATLSMWEMSIGIKHRQTSTTCAWDCTAQAVLRKYFSVLLFFWRLIVIAKHSFQVILKVWAQIKLTITLINRRSNGSQMNHGEFLGISFLSTNFIRNKTWAKIISIIENSNQFDLFQKAFK